MMKTIEKLAKMPYAQAQVVRVPNRIDLISYNTRVAYIVGGVLVVTGLISATTRKHISAFVQQFCGCDYSVAKKCFTDEVGYDIIEKKYIAIPD